jgi:hypothetical protein
MSQTTDKAPASSADTRLVATVEPDGDQLLVLLPDGEVRSAKDSAAALKIVQKWGKRRTRESGETTVTQLDWRGGAVPPGIAPGSVEVPIDDEDERAAARTAAGLRRHAQREAAREHARQSSSYQLPLEK